MGALSAAAPSSDTHALAHGIHDLATALWFGGSVMGIAGVNKSGADLHQGIDRVRLGLTSKSRIADQRGYGTLVTAEAVAATR